jgi:hypothetical protein
MTELRPPPQPLPHLPRPWIIALLVTAVWWPVRTYWLSDDWLAVHYAQDFGRALSDFHGNQYGLRGLVWFYRPLITLSFAIESAIAGADPFVSHLTNAVAQGIGAMLLGMLVCRFFGAAAGFWAALLWGVAPVNAASVLWAVGRVDCHTIPWLLLSALFTVRWCDRRTRTRVPALAFFVLALCSKELAVAMPGIAAILCFALAPPGQRLARACFGAWPFFAVLLLYFAWRRLVLGQVVGGYANWVGDPTVLLEGLGAWLLRLLNPLSYMEAEGLARFGLPPSALGWTWLGYLPAAAGLLVLLRKRPLALLGAAAAFLCCVAPTVQFWPYVTNPTNFRYFGLGFCALVVVLAARPWIAVPALLVTALPHLDWRRDYLESFDRSREIHERLRAGAAEVPRGPLYVFGLPHQHPKLTAVEYHIGIDRILAPPFGDGHRVFALRPLGGGGGTFIPYGVYDGLPEGTTLSLRGGGQPRVLAPTPLPRIDVALEGTARLTSDVLEQMRQGSADPAFVLGTPRAPWYRITLLSACGYLGGLVPNESAADVDGGRVRVRTWFGASNVGAITVGEEIRLPVALDLELRFPLLVEAGDVTTTPAGPVFEPTHVGRTLLWVEFDGDYAPL